MRLAPFQHAIDHEICNSYWCVAFCVVLDVCISLKTYVYSTGWFGTRIRLSDTQ